MEIQRQPQFEAAFITILVDMLDMDMVEVDVVDMDIV